MSLFITFTLPYLCDLVATNYNNILIKIVRPNSSKQLIFIHLNSNVL